MANEMFVIEKVTVRGEKIEPSEVTFGPHLNIIYGPSNCGKTMILKCIDYLLGAKAKPFPPKKYGYKTVEMILSTNEGKIYLSRDIGSSTVHVSSEDKAISSGDYLAKSSKNAVTFGQALLGLIGIDCHEPTKVFSTEKAIVGNLSLRTLVNTFIVKEEPIIQENNIFVPRGASITLLKSSVLYMMTGENYITGKEKTPEWVSNEKTLYKYEDERVKKLEEENQWLTMGICSNLEDDLNAEAEKKVARLDEDYRTLEQKYNEAIQKSLDVAKRVSDLGNKLVEDNDLLEKFRVLDGKYAADIERMKNIIQGKILSDGLTETETCQFCGSKIQHHEQQEDCVKAASAELIELEPKKKDLESAVEQLKEERDAVERDLLGAQRENDAIRQTIELNIQPKMTEIKEVIRSYGQTCRDAERKTITRKEYEIAEASRDKISEEMKAAITEFDPNDHFGQMEADMTERLQNALKSCHFEQSEIARFDVASFDIAIGDGTKADYGKGYRAFLNSVCSFTLHRYFAEKAKYFGTPFIIDSPILSLREIEREKEADEYEDNPQEMKAPLFKYFLEGSKNSQTIIIENDIPQIEYGDTKFIHYTRDKNDPKNYGFLVNVR
jgi:hypothetical protein